MSALSRRVRQFANPAKWRYLLGGLGKRLWQPRRCPSCRSGESTAVDRKFVFSLERCSHCGLQYKYPTESSAEMDCYYQEDYGRNEVLLSTRTPPVAEIDALAARGFAGTELDFGNVVQLFRLLKVPAGGRVLDFGASWGFGTLQLCRAGYEAVGFEISRPRAELGRRLGVDMHESLDSVGDAYDVVYSSHVLEHVPNPLDAVRDQLRRTRPGGFVVAHTPNGSDAFRRANPRLFHLLWGLSHPVLLSDAWVERNWPVEPHFLSSGNDRHVPPELAQWDGESRSAACLDQPELLVILRRANA